MKHLLSMAGIGLLGGLAIAGWMPKASVTEAHAAPAVQITPAVEQPSPQFQLVSDRRYYRDNYRSDRRAAYRNNGGSYGSSYGYRNDSGYSDDYRYRRERSTGKSVAIVGGSAAAGAAVGGLAGGGKGAAIGAITGGAAGFVYDRLTKNRR